jgi:hypothetical protein
MAEGSSVGCTLPIGGLSVSSALGVAFIILKITGKIDWSWWWVTCPFWAGYAAILLFFALMLGGFAALMGMAGLADWWSRRR